MAALPSALAVSALCQQKPWRRMSAIDDFARKLNFEIVLLVRIALAPPTWPQPLILCARLSAIGPYIGSHFQFEPRTSNWQGRLILLRTARFSLMLWTSKIWYGARNSSVSSCLRVLTKWASGVPLEQAIAFDQKSPYAISMPATEYGNDIKFELGTSRSTGVGDPLRDGGRDPSPARLRVEPDQIF